jgi:hypothetical protein
MSNYQVVSMIVTAAEAADLNLMLDNSGIEGCVNVFGRPCWPDDTTLVYDAFGQVDLAKSPPPTHYMANGWLRVDAIALLPENAFVPEVV